MIVIHRTEERHHELESQQEVWLSFHPGDREAPLAEGFGSLESLAETRLAPGGRARRRSYREAEILTYLSEGALSYEDSTGASGVLLAGEFQHTTAGRGLRRREANASRDHVARVFQLRLRPSEAGLEPKLEQKRFTGAERRGGLRIVASPDARRGSLSICQDALVYSALLDPGQHVVHDLAPDRSVWLHVVDGQLTLDGVVLCAGDGVGLAEERVVSLTAAEETEILLVDLGNERLDPSDSRPRSAASRSSSEGAAAGRLRPSPSFGGRSTGATCLVWAPSRLERNV